jgi:type II secretory pathway pseudopilin PulG
MRRPSFTLIELLLAVGIIGSLAAITITAINPGRQLAQARNAQRRSHVNTILNAIHQHMIDNAGVYATGIDTTLRMLGTASGGCAVCGAGGAGTGASITIISAIDASIWQASPTTNYGSTADLWVYPWTPSWTRRALIRFDLSSIPAGATISSARVYMHEYTTFGFTRTIGFYRLTRNWTDSGVTWNSAQSGVPWTTAGGDAIGSPTATATLTWDGVLGWNSWNVTSDVQAFVNGTQTNNGWLIRDTSEDSSQNYWFFHSRQSPTSSLRPYLNVTYSGGGGGGAGACLNLSPPLVSRYLPSIPVDPSTGSPARTYYAVMRTAQGRLSVRACSAEHGETIEAER